MKKIVISASFILSVLVAYTQKQYVDITYVQEDGVSVVLDGALLGENRTSVKVDFELSKDILFFKRGYYTQRVEIDADVIISKMKVDLVKKPSSAALPEKTLLKPDTLLVSDYVTNMDDGDIWEVLNSNFIKNNYYIGNSSSLFPGAKNEIQDSRYKLGIEIVSSDQVSNVYKSPKFMMAYIKIRWALLDKVSNEVTYFQETEGSYFVKVSRTKGMVISDKMRVVMEGAMKEAQFKLLTDNEFIKMVQEK
jgi:hypothetical protein